MKENESMQGERKWEDSCLYTVSLSLYGLRLRSGPPQPSGCCVALCAPRYAVLKCHDPCEPEMRMRDVRRQWEDSSVGGASPRVASKWVCESLCSPRSGRQSSAAARTLALQGGSLRQPPPQAQRWPEGRRRRARAQSASRWRWGRRACRYRRGLARATGRAAGRGGRRRGRLPMRKV